MDLSTLNPEQIEAALHTDGPCCVVAGAGSGKTRVLTYRVANLIELGVPARNILAVTFTKKAAGEMQERLAALIGNAYLEDLNVGTFHSVCYRILRDEWKANEDCLYEPAQEGWCRRAVRDILDPKKMNWNLDVSAALGFISWQKNNLITPKDKLDMGETEPFLEDKFRDLYKQYESAKDLENKLDFDDMLLWCYQLFRDHPYILRKYQSRFKHIMVDECVPFETPIILADGNLMPIGEIVEERLPVEVLTYNELTGVQEAKPITGYHRIPLSKKLYRMVVLRKNDGLSQVTRQVSYGINTLVATEDHVVFTDRGWLSMRDIRIGDTVQLESKTAISPKLPDIRHFNTLFKHSNNGRKILSDSMIDKNKAGICGQATGYGRIKVRGGNGRGPTVSEQILLDILDTGWIWQYAISTDARSEGYPTCYKIDIANPDLMIGIEVDGHSHNSKKRRLQDAKKDTFLAAKGWKIYRVRNEEIHTELNQILAHISELVNSNAKAICANGINCPVAGEVISIEAIKTKIQYIYDITVADNHNFYANGVLVHNCQDINTAQYEIVKLVAAPENNLFMVGDARQAIYGWRAARVEFILNFEKAWPNARVIVLKTNYRSSQNIVEMSNRLIGRGSIAYPGECRAYQGTSLEPIYCSSEDEDAEAEFITSEMQALLQDGFQYRDFTCLYRVNAQSRALEDALIQAQIPYVVLGAMGFYNRKEVKDIISYMRILADPNDEEAISRVLNVPTRYLGKAFLAGAKTYARVQGVPLLDAVEKCPDAHLYKYRGVHDFMFCIKRLRRLECAPAELTIQARKITGYDQWLAESEGTEDGADNPRVENLNALAAAAARFSKLEDFLFYVEQAQAKPADPDTSGNRVQLMTLHRSKGLEFPVVFLAGMVQGLLPHQRSCVYLDGELVPESVEEERRLCYVGMTRAQKRLYLSTVVEYQGKPAERSMFLSEIGEEMQGAASGTEDEDRTSSQSHGTGGREIWPAGSEGVEALPAVG